MTFTALAPTPLSVPKRRAIIEPCCPIDFTRHAEDRMTEFGLTSADIIRLLDDTEFSYSSREQRVHVAGDWALVMDHYQRRPRLVTVLRRLMEDWEHAA